MLRAAFIGAGSRATRAHYPALARASAHVELQSICELDEERLESAADAYDIEGR